MGASIGAMQLVEHPYRSMILLMVRSKSGVFKPVEVGSFMPFIYRVFEHKFQKVVGIPWDFWLPSNRKNP